MTTDTTAAIAQAIADGTLDPAEQPYAERLLNEYGEHGLAVFEILLIARKWAEVRREIREQCGRPLWNCGGLYWPS